MEDLGDHGLDKNKYFSLVNSIMKKPAAIFIVLLLLAPTIFAKPCCPEDPEHMTFDFIRNNPDYLIGNHVGDELPFLVRWWFYNEKANVYSWEGIFVIGFQIKNGKVFGYSESEYGKPTVIFYAKEDGIDRIWLSEHMVIRFLYEVVKHNIIIKRSHSIGWHDWDD